MADAGTGRAPDHHMSEDVAVLKNQMTVQVLPQLAEHETRLSSLEKAKLFFLGALFMLGIIFGSGHTLELLKGIVK